MVEALPRKPFYEEEIFPDQKKKVIEQVADVMIELTRHPLPLVGSLKMEGDHVDVSAVARNRFVALDTYGLFDTASGICLSITEQYMNLVADGQLHHDHPLEAFLLYRFVRQNVPQIVGHIPGQFFLSHVDDK